MISTESYERSWRHSILIQDMCTRGTIKANIKMARRLSSSKPWSKTILSYQSSMYTTWREQATRLKADCYMENGNSMITHECYSGWRTSNPC